MCGINLYLGDDETVIHKMNLRLLHRGLPGRDNTYSSDGIYLGHVRLPIQGLDEEYDQPYRNGKWIFCFAGEIFNYKEINSKAQSDIEVVADMWLREGIECFKKFEGFWSFIAHNIQTGEIHIVTDYLAKKPLYIDMNTFSVSSEIKPLLIASYSEIDEQYFSSVRKWGYNLNNRTPFENIQKIPPCSHWIIKGNWKYSWILKKETYTTLRPKKTNLREAIEKAVKRRLVSDIPISLVLSGGLDSTIVFELMKKHSTDFTVFHVPNVL